MVFTKLKICKLIYFLAIILLIYYASCQDNFNHLTKYNQLYYAPKFSLKFDFNFDEEEIPVCNNKTVSYICNGKGKCSDTNQNMCVCDVGYYTIPGSYIQCTYMQKSKLTALLLEGLVGFGLGHFYIGKYYMFMAKFLVYFFSCYFGFCIMVFVGAINGSNVKPETFSSTKVSAIVLFPLIIGWWAFDVVMFMMNKYTDNFDMPLA